MYSGPSTWKGIGWNGRPLRDMSAPCLPPSVCALACLTVQKVKTVLFSRSINPAYSFTSLLPRLTVVCVLRTQFLWIFWPQNRHLAPIALKNWHLSWLHLLYIPWSLQKRLTHLWFLVFTRGGLLLAALWDMTSLSPQCQLRQVRRVTENESICLLVDFQRWCQYYQS